MPKIHAVLITLLLVAGCGDAEQPSSDGGADGSAAQESGLKIRTIANGYGRAAEPGDFVTVHYTGWLYDENAPDNRGAKFDSSVDRGEKFQFPLGAGRVIKILE